VSRRVTRFTDKKVNVTWVSILIIFYPQILLWLFIQIQVDSELLHERIAKRKKQIHPEHSARFNHDMQLQIDCIEWILEEIEVSKIPNDRLEGLIRNMIKDLEKRKEKATRRPDTDDLWI
jgi:hypothetical protein